MDELQKDLGGSGEQLVLSIGCYQLPAFHRFFKLEEERRLATEASLDDHISYQSGTHALGAEFGSAEDAVSLKDDIGGCVCGVAEIFENTGHAAGGLQGNEGLIME